MQFEDMRQLLNSPDSITQDEDCDTSQRIAHELVVPVRLLERNAAAEPRAPHSEAARIE